MRRAACLALLLATVSRGIAADTAPETPSGGERLYTGRAALTAVIAGQDTPMPAGVLACTNCHAARPAQAGGDGQPAPDLRGGWLSRIIARRNGPAGRYTQPSFCRTLRTGVDPLGIVLAVQMPRFAMSEQECGALWAYLNPAE